ncbi:MFS family permease [Scopulibacillus daqui]|uniref:MFS family permease n=1 Tax=Scopulibacillus daqui TaxID=1469162 RepID=A0ABS2PYR4_9BACL|nr:MFS family permease [Scopulibacillus daqui]
MKWKDWDTNLKVRLLGEGVSNMLFWMYFPFMSIYFSNAFGKEKAGLLLVVSQVIGVVIGLIGGYCADHFGRKRMMVISAVGNVLCFIFFALGNSPWLASPILTFMSFSALGLFGALYMPASHAMVADVVPEQHRASVFAVFYTSINVSVVIGPILGGIFFFNYRFELLLACLAVSIILTIILQKFIDETKPEKISDNEKQSSLRWTDYVSQQLADYRVIITDKVFLMFIIAGVLVAQTFMQLDLLMAVYSTEQVPKQTLISIGDWSLVVDGKHAFSWFVSENGLLVVLLTVIMTKWMTKYRERNVFISSALLYGIAIIIFGQSANVWTLFFAVAVFTAAELMVTGIQESFVSKLAPKHMRGQYFAAASLRYSIGRSIAPLAIPMTVWFGFRWTFIILGALSFISAALYGGMFKMLDHRRNHLPQTTAIK